MFIVVTSHYYLIMTAQQAIYKKIITMFIF